MFMSLNERTIDKSDFVDFYELMNARGTYAQH